MTAPITFSRAEAELSDAPLNDFYVTDVDAFPAAYWDSIDTNPPGYYINLAWNEVLADLQAWLSAGYTPRQGYTGGLGQVSATQYITVANQLATLPITLKAKIGASVSITALSMLVDTSITQVIELLNDQDEVLHSVELAIGARTGIPQPLSTPWVIPADGRVYRITAQLPGIVRVGKNTLYCGGCSRNLGGLTSILHATSLEATGFTMQINSLCDTDIPVQRLLDTKPYGAVIRKMVGYKAAYKMLFQPPNGIIERSTVLASDDLAALLKLYDSIYSQGLAWIKSQSLTIDLYDTCLEARRGATVGRLGTLFR